MLSDVSGARREVRREARRGGGEETCDNEVHVCAHLPRMKNRPEVCRGARFEVAAECRAATACVRIAAGRAIAGGGRR